MILDSSLNMRTNSKEMAKFDKKCEELKTKSQVLLREFVTAFNDGRMTITPTAKQQELYK